MPRNNTNIKRIIITGPESTGKSTLAEALAAHYQTTWIAEYARTYIEKLNRPYTYADIVFIAEYQVEQLNKIYRQAREFVFFDTGLILTKVWFEVVFNKKPKWIDQEIIRNKPDLYLLCNTDIEWVADNVRENGGEKRNRLFEIYKNEIENFGFRYKIISGKNKMRLKNAINFLDNIQEKISVTKYRTELI